MTLESCQAGMTLDGKALVPKRARTNARRWGPMIARKLELQRLIAIRVPGDAQDKEFEASDVIGFDMATV